MVNVIILQYCLMTFLGVTIFYGLIAGFFIFMNRRKYLLNPIDVVIVELTQNGIRGRMEIGRKQEYKGMTRVVTVGKGGNISKIKDNLGYSITDDDMTLSTRGRNRNFLIVAMKDHLTAPLRVALDEGNDDFSKEEKDLLSKVYDTSLKPVSLRIDKIPGQLSLTPVLSEQTRFLMDYKEEKVLMTGEDPAKAHKRMLLLSAGVFVITIVICLVLFVLMLNQGPGVAAGLAAKSMSAVAPVISPVG